MPVTYIRGWTLVGTWAGERDKFMAPLVHNETADCKRENKGRRREKERGRKRERRGRERWLKPGFTASKGFLAK